MKKYYSFILVAAAAITFASCAKELDVRLEPVDKEVEMMTITVNPTIQMTKTTLIDDHSKIEWTSGNKIKVYNNINTSASNLTYSAGNPMTVSVPVGTTEIYSQWPGQDNSEGATKVLLSIPNAQTQAAPGELNGDYYPMVAKGTVSDGKANMVFYPVAGALALNIWNSNLSGTENVKSVTAVPYTTAYIGAQADTDITGSDVTYSSPASTLPVCVTLTSTLSIADAKPTNTKTYDGQIYICMAKKSYSGIKFIIETDKNFYTKDATAATFDLASNDFLPVNINLATCSMMEATDYDSYTGAITAGDYIIYYDGKALKAGVSSNRFTYASVTPDANGTITTSDPSIVWHIAASSTFWTLFNEAKQQFAASTGAASKGQLLYDGTDDKSLWSFTGTSTYDAENKQNKANKVNSLLRNNGTYGWACYAAGTGGAFSLYKLSTRTLSSIALSGSYKTTFNVNEAFDHTGLVVTATFSDDTNKDVTSEATFSNPDMTSAGVKTITVGYSYKGVEKTKTYSITVNDAVPYTVTFGDNSSTLTEASVGAGVVLPSRSGNATWTFAGWAVASIASETTTAPASILTAGSTYYPTSNITLHPVYRRTGSSTTWTKITDLSSVGAGTYALLTTDGHAFNGTITKGHGQVTSSAFSFTAGVASSAPSGTCELTLAASGTGYTMYNSDLGYLYSKEAKSGSLAWAANTATADNVWKYNNSNWMYDTTYFRSYSNSSFRTYSSSSNGDLLVMALKGSTSVTYYISVIS